MKIAIECFLFLVCYGVVGSVMEKMGVESVKIYAFVYCLMGIFHMFAVSRVLDSKGADK
jgi:hypothetical protein